MTENERLGQLEICQAKIEAQVKQNTKGIEDLKLDNKAIHDIATSVQVMATEMKGMSQQMSEMKEDISEVKTQVNEVETRPARETAKVVSKVKIAIYTSIGTSVAIGIIGSLVIFLK